MPLIPPLAAAPTQRAPSDWPRWRPLRWAVRILFGLVSLTASFLLIAWLTLHWGILPHIEQWRPQIEARASAALGVPVRIGAIEVRSSGWVPAVELRDVVLLDASDRPALTLPRVAAAVSPRSLLSFELRFEQLLIEGAQLDVRRDAQGRLFVAGLDIGGRRRRRRRAARLVLPAARVRHPRRHAALDRRTPRRRRRSRSTRSSWWCATACCSTSCASMRRPDAAWGERFSLRGRFTQPLLARAGDWQRWSGSAFVDLPRVDVQRTAPPRRPAVRAERGRRRRARLARSGRGPAAQRDRRPRAARGVAAARAHGRRRSRSSRSRGASSHNAATTGSRSRRSTSASSPATASAGRRAT